MPPPKGKGKGKGKRPESLTLVGPINEQANMAEAALAAKGKGKDAIVLTGVGHGDNLLVNGHNINIPNMMEVMSQHGPLLPRPNEQQFQAALDFLINDGVFPQGAQIDQQDVVAR